jgi:paraquat-inducible protein B
MMDSLVAHGVRAQLRTGNLLTGALYVAFDFFPDAPATTVDWSQTPVRLPTIPGELEAIEASVVSIIKKIDQLPIEALGKDLEKAMAELDRTLVSARGALDSGRGTLDSANKLIEPNSVLGAELGNTLQEVSRAARAVRVLADYLERHPEALIRGKTGGSK